MQRRRIGLAVLMLAVLAMVMVPRAIDRPIAGTPQIGPIAQAPSEGSCLPPFADQAELDALTTPHTVPCDQPHGAEVTLVMGLGSASEPDPVWPTSGTDRILAEPIAACQARNAGFTGASGTSGVLGAPHYQRVPPRYRSKVTVPSRIQWLAGQRWYACSVVPDTPAPISYTGTAAGSMFATPPAPFATCATAPHGTPVPCDRPHTAEQLTIGDAGSAPSWPPSPLENANTCRVLAATIIGAPDPEFGGLIEITGWFDGSGMSCWLRAADGRTLVGTLIGHGSGPLPIS